MIARDGGVENESKGWGVENESKGWGNESEGWGEWRMRLRVGGSGE